MSEYFNLEWGSKHVQARVLSTCEDIVDETAKAVLRDAEAKVSVDSGELKSTLEIVKFRKPGIIGAYVKAGGNDYGHIARFVELGTPGTAYRYGKRKNKARTPIKAKPYLRPSLKKNKKIYLKYKDVLDKYK